MEPLANDPLLPAPGTLTIPAALDDLDALKLAVEQLQRGLTVLIEARRRPPQP